MTTTQVKKLSIIAVTWPIFIESLLHISLRTADTFMLSKVSDEAVAAVGVANQLIMFMFFLFQFVATGTSVIVAQYLGAKKYDEINKYIGNGILLNFIFGLFVATILIIFSKQFLSLFQLEPELLVEARTFLIIVGGALVFQAMSITMSVIIQTHGFTKETMFVSGGMNIVNIIGNYLFIYGALGFPQWGVPGVAIATAFSQFLALIAFGFVLYYRVNLRLTWNDFIEIQKERLKKVLSIGIPSSMTILSYSSSQIVTTSFITLLGTQMLATRIYTLNLLFFVMVLGISLGRGSQIITGHLIGAGEMEEAYKQGRRNVRWSILLALLMTVIIVLVREPLLGLFTNDPAIIQMGGILLIMGFLLEPGRCLNLVYGATLQAAGDARYMMIVSVVVIWGFSVPLYYLLGIHFGWGLIGIWLAFIADEWVRGIALWARWKNRKWESKALVKQKKTDSEVSA
ncbi:MATE family efflux transporter [Halalkalibacter akibai]|uniref:Multi antimicrobial extrusion protein n=1 Tax=Halalkalibacter akibai (strain ATCC 43226 / DSM 21942 / CIP 109018 / JCM 9157 / 1139) TaxID=1236973 RepID=W4QPZ2_HALA3|nr:MATE family efflux transporter [Halalkalibacter akibai]GAE33967.1 multi antimicrobial extrusion protein [Halalkalibacter akibai JCM 9157]